MGVSGIGTNNYVFGQKNAAGYAAQKTENSKPQEETANMSWTVKSENHDIILHGEESAEDGKVVAAWACVTGNTSMTVYQPHDFDPAHPVYKVKVWDSHGNMTERMVDISEVDPADCDTIDMYAYSAWLSKSGKCPDALQKFMSAHAHHKDRGGKQGYGSLFDKENWLEIIKEVMEMQYRAGNLKGYIDYKRFLGVLEIGKEENEKKAQSGGNKTDQEESKVETDIQVKPDGSRVHVMTRTVGGMAATTSIELSKPTDMPNNKAEEEEAKEAWSVPDISDLSAQLFGE